MVGHREGGHPGVDRALGVVDPADALDHERAAPLLAHPLDVLPGGHRGGHPLVVGAEEGRGLAAGRGQVGGGEVGDVPDPAELPHPPRLGDHLRRQPDHRLQVDLLRDLRAAPVAAHGERPVEGGDQALGAGGAGAVHALDHDVAVAGPVHLEEGVRVGLHDLLDGLAGEVGQADHRAAGGGGPGDGDLALGVHGLHAGGGDDHGQRDGQAHHGGVHVALGLLPGDVRGEAELGEGGGVVVGRHAALGAGDAARRRPTRAGASSRGSARRRPSRTTGSGPTGWRASWDGASSPPRVGMCFAAQ